jgi:hypothetical protein
VSEPELITDELDAMIAGLALLDDPKMRQLRKLLEELDAAL